MRIHAVTDCRTQSKLASLWTLGSGNCAVWPVRGQAGGGWLCVELCVCPTHGGNDGVGGVLTWLKMHQVGRSNQVQGACVGFRTSMGTIWRSRSTRDGAWSGIRTCIGRHLWIPAQALSPPNGNGGLLSSRAGGFDHGLVGHVDWGLLHRPEVWRACFSEVLLRANVDQLSIGVLLQQFEGAFAGYCLHLGMGKLRSPESSSVCFVQIETPLQICEWDKHVLTCSDSSACPVSDSSGSWI